MRHCTGNLDQREGAWDFRSQPRSLAGVPRAPCGLYKSDWMPKIVKHDCFLILQSLLSPGFKHRAWHPLFTPSLPCMPKHVPAPTPSHATTHGEHTGTGTALRSILHRIHMPKPCLFRIFPLSCLLSLHVCGSNRPSHHPESPRRDHSNCTARCTWSCTPKFEPLAASWS